MPERGGLHEATHCAGRRRLCRGTGRVQLRIVSRDELTTCYDVDDPLRSAPATKDTQVWLCKPDRPGDPCLTSLTTTVIGPDGTKTVRQSAPAANPKIDCFYVCPTVSQQTTPNANLTIDTAERSVAIAQASRFSQVCRVFAPMYRQITIAGLNSTNATPGKIAFQDVPSAWNDYLARYNDGRGVVLIGHSQGTFHLRQLISKSSTRRRRYGTGSSPRSCSAAT